MWARQIAASATIVYAATYSHAGWAADYSIAICPTGTTLVGGAFLLARATPDLSDNISPWYSSPQPGNQWVVYAGVNGGTNAYKAIAVCI